MHLSKTRNKFLLPAQRLKKPIAKHVVFLGGVCDKRSFGGPDNALTKYASEAEERENSRDQKEKNGPKQNDYSVIFYAGAVEQGFSNGDARTARGCEKGLLGVQTSLTKTKNNISNGARGAETIFPSGRGSKWIENRCFRGFGLGFDNNRHSFGSNYSLDASGALLMTHVLRVCWNKWTRLFSINQPHNVNSYVADVILFFRKHWISWKNTTYSGLCFSCTLQDSRRCTVGWEKNSIIIVTGVK